MCTTGVIIFISITNHRGQLAMIGCLIIDTSLGSRPSPYVRVYFECFLHAHNENAHVRGRPGTKAT